MPVRDFFGVLRRRWLVILVGFLLTVGLSAVAYKVFKPTYEATATILLLPPASSLVKGSTNPYLQLGGLAQTVDLVGVSLSDQATQLELQAISKDVQYTVKGDVNTSSPLLVIDVKDSTSETAVQIRDLLIARVPVRLDELQGSLGVAPNDRVTSALLTRDAQAEEVGKNRLRAAVVAAVLGLALTLLTGTLWDKHRRRKPKRRGRRRLGPKGEEAAARSITDGGAARSMDDQGAARSMDDQGAARSMDDQGAPPSMDDQGAAQSIDADGAGRSIDDEVQEQADLVSVPTSPVTLSMLEDEFEEPADVSDDATL